MAQQFGIVITGDVKEFLSFTNVVKHRKAIEREIRKATIKSSRFLVRQVKKAINQRKFTKNSELTLALANKGLTPLKKFQNLFKAIEFELRSSFESEIGLIKDTQTTGGVTGKKESMKKVAFLLHEGYTIDVTDDMRAAIAIELRKKGTRRSKRVLESMKSVKGKSTFRVPPRKFFSRTFRNPVIQKIIKNNWKIAIERALSSTSMKRVKASG